MAYTGAEKKDMEKLLKKGKNNLGLIAQELQQVYPQLVEYNAKTDLLSVNYEKLIPVLIGAIQEQQETIITMGKALKSLQNDCCTEKETKTGSVQQNDATNMFSVDVAALEQNTPNPFNENTTIRYSLPDEVQKAVLYIYDMQGTQIKSYLLAQRGNSSITINGSELKAGMYLYTLIADSKEVDTKRMILTK